MVATVAMAGTVALARVNETEKKRPIFYVDHEYLVCVFLHQPIGLWACGLFS